MKDNQITLSKLIIIFLCLLISGCQTFISKEEIEIVEDPWQKLSLDKKIAQMIMFRLKGDITNETTFEYKKFHRWINELGIGGAVVYGGGLEETFNRIQIAQSWSETPLFIAADYERGLGQWYDGATLFPTNMAVAATGRNVLAYDCLLYTSPSPRDRQKSRMPSSA